MPRPGVRRKPKFLWQPCQLTSNGETAARHGEQALGKLSRRATVLRLTRLRRDYGVASTAAATTLTSMMHRKRTMIDGIKGADRSQRLRLQFFCGWYSLPLQHKCSPQG